MASDMGGGLSKLATGLVVVFAVAVTAILAELFYVLWRRRRFRLQNFSVDDPQFHCECSFSNSSKELLYFFCWKTQTRIEPAGAPDTRTIGAIPDAPPEEDLTDVLKLQGLYGPSRFLFTIKEEEREDLESDVSSSVEKKTKKVSLEECFGVVVEAMPEVVGVAVDADDATPFSTPCASPVYYTPSPSPSREVESGVDYLIGLPENVDVVERESPEGDVSGENVVSVICLEVHSE